MLKLDFAAVSHNARIAADKVCFCCGQFFGVLIQRFDRAFKAGASDRGEFILHWDGPLELFLKEINKFLWGEVGKRGQRFGSFIRSSFSLLLWR